jgi:hypothetical protein
MTTSNALLLMMILLPLSAVFKNKYVQIALVLVALCIAVAIRFGAFE